MADDDLRLALLHGFTQSGAAWAPVLERLGLAAVTPDLPGHGGAAGVEADLWGTADRLAAEVGPATWLGYSLGGRVALHLALAHPEVVEGLVLVSATAGIEDSTARAERRASDEVLARRVEAEGVEAFVRWWLALPMWATLPPGAAALDARLGGSAAGLASSLRLAGAGAMEPLWDRLGSIDVPTLVVAGELDTAYAERAARLGGAIAGAEVAIVAGAGHACHLERPEEFCAIVGDWLGRHGHTARPTAKSTPKTSTS